MPLDCVEINQSFFLNLQRSQTEKLAGFSELKDESRPNQAADFFSKYTNRENHGITENHLGRQSFVANENSVNIEKSISEESTPSHFSVCT